ncbi:hypothetical protein HanXRQr2_Chr04g0154921 [Helianthus annuus]|uniref:Uncharacterized protein n=1 Tax=Helianthus annuus TaxID=4232 RepID=A0A9K3J5P3_HELAN|nr:hypothetical protein HanXRQr2_Chr04g0154921 [Helianthus annuus]KAJ0930404.1 hypothetical protein HanPSC8_Chr04g0148971 [Helianthus annuus]
MTQHTGCRLRGPRGACKPFVWLSRGATKCCISTINSFARIHLEFVQVSISSLNF